jgi:SAM-dependent methyltransferase
MAQQTQLATKLVVDGAALTPGHRVLDLASGTGEPATTIARVVGASGRVTATDLVPEMLAVIHELVETERITNMAVEVADMEQLPYRDASFDRVTSRFGIMFPPDAVQAAKEIRRVLVPGGRVSLLAWGPPTLSFWTSVLGPFMKRAALPPPPADAPSPLRFAKPGSLSEVLRAAGLASIEETSTTIPLHWPGSADELFRMQREIVAQLFERFRAALSASDFEAAMADVHASLVAAERAGNVHLEAVVHLVTAAR